MMHSLICRPRLTGVVFAAAALLSCPLTASAQVLAPELAAAEAAPDYRWGLGLAAGMSKSPYRQFDDKADVLPLILFESRWISVFGTKLDVKLPSAGPLSLRLRARYSGDGYDADDSPYLAGMEKRKGGLWLGGAAIWRNEVANLAAEATTATGDAQGKRFKLELNHEFKSGALTVTPRIAADWYDAKFVDYYYGVRAGEARAGRLQYAGDAANNVEAGVRLGYAVGAHHHLFVDLSATRLGSGIKASPLVERSSERSVRLGYLYGF